MRDTSSQQRLPGAKRIGSELPYRYYYVAINKYKISFFNNQCSKVHETFICESEELGVDIKGKECLRKILMKGEKWFWHLRMDTYSFSMPWTYL